MRSFFSPRENLNIKNVQQRKATDDDDEDDNGNDNNIDTTKKQSAGARVCVYTIYTRDTLVRWFVHSHSHNPWYAHLHSADAHTHTWNMQ